MKQSVPWSVKGVEADARETAKELARRSGMTLGQWLNAMIAEQTAEGEGAVPGGSASAALDNLADRLESLTRRGTSTATPLQPRMSEPGPKRTPARGGRARPARDGAPEITLSPQLRKRSAVRRSDRGARPREQGCRGEDGQCVVGGRQMDRGERPSPVREKRPTDKPSPPRAERKPHVDVDDIRADCCHLERRLSDMADQLSTGRAPGKGRAGSPWPAWKAPAPPRADPSSSGRRRRIERQSHARGRSDQSAPALPRRGQG